MTDQVLSLAAIDADVAVPDQLRGPLGSLRRHYRLASGDEVADVAYLDASARWRWPVTVARTLEAGTRAVIVHHPAVVAPDLLDALDDDAGLVLIVGGATHAPAVRAIAERAGQVAGREHIIDIVSFDGLDEPFEAGRAGLDLLLTLASVGFSPTIDQVVAHRRGLMFDGAAGAGWLHASAIHSAGPLAGTRLAIRGPFGSIEAESGPDAIAAPGWTRLVDEAGQFSPPTRYEAPLRLALLDAHRALIEHQTPPSDLTTYRDVIRLAGQTAWG